PKMSDKIDELIANEKIAIAPLAFIRGRTLTKIFFIVDEAQNLTPHEIKTIISRAGEHTKIVFTGDIYQIDTPYLDAESNGLSYLIEHVKDHPLYAHITLQKGEGSELANLANDLLERPLHGSNPPRFRVVVVDAVGEHLHPAQRH